MALNSQLALLILYISSLTILLSSFSTAAHEIEAASAPVSQISTAPAANYPSTTEEDLASLPLLESSTTEPTLPASSNSQTDVKAVVNKMEKNMMVTMQKTEDFLKVIKKRLTATAGESRSEECLKTCIEVYEEAIDGLKNSIEDLSSGNYYKVNVDVSAVSTDMDTCDECYSEMLGEDPELRKFDKWVEGITSEWLGDLQTVSG
ncbi:hypothetical protein LguiA_011307 [Lonicera macranthoides]